MTKGLTPSSSPIAISQQVTVTTSANTPQSSVTPIDLQLNPLDNEVFVVTAVKIDFLNLPTPAAGTPGVKEMFQEVSICKSRPNNQQTIGNSNVIASSRMMGFCQIGNEVFVTHTPYTLLENSAMDTPPATQDYLDIIATDNFFIQFNTSDDMASQNLEVAVRVYGYRARAGSSVYAALVQSEVLSAN